MAAILKNWRCAVPPNFAHRIPARPSMLPGQSGVAYATPIRGAG
jgi:hypothetical protein